MSVVKSVINWVLWSLVISPVLVGQTPHVRFESLNSQHGLSQNTANAIVQDRLGYIWIGTEDGLNRYNGHELNVFRYQPNNPNSLRNNTVESLFFDSQQRLWIGTNGGLSRLEQDGKTMTHFVHDPQNPKSLSANKVWVTYEDKNGGIWVGTDKGGLNYLDEKRNEFKRFEFPDLKPEEGRGINVRALQQDRAGRLWIGTNRGLFYLEHGAVMPVFASLASSEFKLPANPSIMALALDSQGHLWIGLHDHGLVRSHVRDGILQYFYHQPEDPRTLIANGIRSLLFDGEGRLWVGTRTRGISLMDMETASFQHFQHAVFRPKSIGHDRIQCLMVDRSGVLWIGTNGGGVNRLALKNLHFNHYLHSSADDGDSEKSRSFVKALFEDQYGILWVGSLRGGLIEFDRSQHRLVTHTHRANDPNSLSHNGVWTIYEDRQGRFWVGTDGGGLNLYDRKRRRFKAFRHDPQDPNSLSNNRVRTMYEDREGRFWVGTLEGGLNLFDRDTGKAKIYRHDPENPNSLSNDKIRAIYQDSEGIFWLGTLRGGLNRFDASRESFKRYPANPEQPQALSHEGVMSICPDNQGYLWLGTYGGGLNRFDPQTETFKTYRLEDGLANEVVYGVLSDQKGHLWMSTNSGISRFNLFTEEFKNFDVKDGLQDNEFNTGAYFRSKKGELFFGGIDGFNAFYPEKIAENRNAPNVVITAFRKLDKQMQPQTVPIPAEGLRLSYEDTFLAFEFSALDFAEPEQNEYRYKMVGFQDHWVPLGNRREMTFTNLDPGQYEFVVKAANSDGYWNDQGASIPITIVPPIWKTKWAYGFYVLALLTGIWFYVRSQRLKLEKERSISEQLRTVDRLKDEFLANTSHELRTPLNGIIGLTQSLLDGAAGPVEGPLADNLTKVVYSGKRLASLVNDILDFSKLKNKSLSLDLKPVDLKGVTEVVFDLLRPLTTHKDLALLNNIGIETPAVMADENRLQQIMYNLIGNAVKFTESGKVRVGAIEENGVVRVTVSDTGVGIAEDHQSKIFESFEQADGSIERHYGGTGLGLAITRKLVELHHGKIWVDSRLGNGATFSFTLPVAAKEKQGQSELLTLSEQLTETLPELPLSTALTAAIDHQPAEGKFKVLIVDDEPVNRQVLINYLSMQNYELIEAAHGLEALNILKTDREIDLVLLDIMMPKMSGFQVCRDIRKMAAFQELPIIFLTAKSQVADLVNGFGCGGNDYLTKPVTKEELLSRVKTHLQLLDINRNLEQKVSERTEELAKKNREILQTQKQLVMQEKMASMGTLTAGIAHEIKNPLHFVNNFSEVSMELSKELQDELSPHETALEPDIYENLMELSGDLVQNTGIIHQHGKRANQIVQSMMELARGTPGESAPTDLNMLVEKFTQLAYHGTQAKERWLPVNIDLDLDSEVGMVMLEAQNMSRVIINLVRNALEALSEKQAKLGEAFVPELKISTAVSGDYAEIRIFDNGLGVEGEHLEKLFDPFFTTKATGDGHIGLGLSMSYDIVVQEHRGELKVNTEPGAFTEFLVRLPKTPASVQVAVD